MLLVLVLCLVTTTLPTWLDQQTESKEEQEEMGGLGEEEQESEEELSVEDLRAKFDRQLAAAGRKNLQFRVERQLEVEGRELHELPEVDRVTRNTSCPGVTEDVVTYRLHITDYLQPDYVDIQQVVVNDAEIKVFSGVMLEPWVEGEAWLRPALNCLAWDDPALVEAVRELLAPPSTLPYNFSVPMDQMAATDLQGEMGQPREVDELVYGGKVQGGFFLEAGSHDSQGNSDSLYWEVEHGWGGLLVEPQPMVYSLGLTRQRKAHSLQTCLSTEPRVASLHFVPTNMVLEGSGLEAMPGLVPTPREGQKGFTMQCFPLYTILLAMGNPTVHHFSLDIEGAEFPVLQTIPWDRVDIRVLSVETHFAGQLYPGGRQEVIDYMDQAGYRHLPAAHQPHPATPDKSNDLFVRRDVRLVGEQEEEEETVEEATKTATIKIQTINVRRQEL